VGDSYWIVNCSDCDLWEPLATIENVWRWVNTSRRISKHLIYKYLFCTIYVSNNSTKRQCCLRHPKFAGPNNRCTLYLLCLFNNNRQNLASNCQVKYRIIAHLKNLKFPQNISFPLHIPLMPTYRTQFWRHVQFYLFDQCVQIGTWSKSRSLPCVFWHETFYY